MHHGIGIRTREVGTIKNPEGGGTGSDCSGEPRLILVKSTFHEIA